VNAQGHVQPGQITVSAIHSNTELTLIQITEDKLRLVLLEHLAKVEAKRRWLVPLGILLTLVPMFLTSDFKDFVGIEKATWKAFFMLATVGTAMWLLLSVRSALQSATTDQLVERIKNIARKEA
jgi:hypothetical protein